MDKHPPIKVYQNRKKMPGPKGVVSKSVFKPQPQSTTFQIAASTDADTVPLGKDRSTAAATRRPVWALKDSTKTGIYDGKPQFVKRRRMDGSSPKEEVTRHKPQHENLLNQRPNQPTCELEKNESCGSVYLLGLRKEQKTVCQIQPGDEELFSGFLAAVESSFRDIQLECPQFQIDNRRDILKKLEAYSKHKSPDVPSKTVHVVRSDSEESVANLNPNKQLHWSELDVQGQGGLPCQSGYSDHSSGNSNWPNHLSRPAYRPAQTRGADRRHLGVIPKLNPDTEFNLPSNLYKEFVPKPPYVDSTHHQARKRVGDSLGPSRTADWMNQPIPSWKPPDHSFNSYASAAHQGVYRTDSNCSSASSDSRRALASNSTGCEPFPNLAKAGNRFIQPPIGQHRREMAPAYRIDSQAARELYGAAGDSYRLASPVPTDSYDAGPYFRPLYPELNFP